MTASLRDLDKMLAAQRRRNRSKRKGARLGRIPLLSEAEKAAMQERVDLLEIAVEWRLALDRRVREVRARAAQTKGESLLTEKVPATKPREPLPDEETSTCDHPR